MQVTIQVWEYIGFLIASSLIFVDWLLGEEKRQEMRDRMRDWWHQIDALGLAQLTTRAAKSTLALVSKVLGTKILSFRFFAVSSTFTAAASLVPIGVYYLLRVLDLPLPTNWELSFPGVFVTVISVTSGIVGYCTCSLTVWLLRKIVDSQNLVFDLAIILFDIVAAAVFQAIIGIARESVIVLSNMPKGTEVWESVAQIAITGVLFAAAPVVAVAAMPEVGLIMVVGLLLFVSAAIIPTFVHLCFALALVAAKLTEPVLNPITSLVLRRLHESEKGVITSMTIAGVVVVEAVYRGALL